MMIAPRHPGPRLRAFTIVEVLVAIAIIVLLAALTITAVSQVRGQAKDAQAKSLLTAMVNATVEFQKDHGFIPPLLDEDRGSFASFGAGDLLDRISNPVNYRKRLYTRYSVTSPAEYLLGYGGWTSDGYGVADDGVGIPVAGEGDDERPTLGIRSPGGDGLWGASVNADASGRVSLAVRRDWIRGNRNGSLQANERRRPENGYPGRPYGPYLETDTPGLLGRLDGTQQPGTGRPNVVFPGEPGYDTAGATVICDPWGNPIQFFRTPSPAGLPGERFVAADYDGNDTVDPPPSLSDWIRLRPWELEPGEGADGITDSSTLIGGGGDTTTSIALESGAFAYFSAGRDGVWADRNSDFRRDEAEFNRDNLVEVGP